MWLRHFLFLILLLFFFCLINHSLCDDSCSYSGGTPEAGSCDGPITRSIAKRSSLSVTNSDCSIGLVPYKKDGSSTILCGECVPGTSGTDSESTCALNEFCTDSASCEHIKSHELYGATCPYDDIISFTSDGAVVGSSWCGTGLRCIQHQCVGCVEGSVNYTGGWRMCVHGEWTTSAWVRITKDPIALAAPLTIILCFLLFILPVSCMACARRKREKIEGLYFEGEESSYDDSY
ncbi:hypothetical protein ADUPG1_012385 [Aduncisulcus paluster]|uniref:Uncharacterized protein n=1 Tax=Aduncisulcus paluster TaxID=2918883 RepID=A0ABQ5K161_9EUKA|nr:hypothetical protein ADUPG1_012385 [Aduncisulcus paluster]